ncbi:ABC transporter ATP-binding protein [Nonomuraea sp. C10]|uniref:ABC transporter ATP-binding protein n=1 Tax=Nonomuraea sp. C10 TaxID=2600577 RepID=UPI0011CE2392|nr:ABC transporter ATP-binding protein [Nonomuraea sp. C10]TXK40163.1 ABC transporter ATP-binding protein [Nonomuraea sp. C10]
MLRSFRRRPAGGQNPIDAPVPPGASPLLEIDGLSVGYEVGGAFTTVLDGVSLTVEDGEFVCVVGASGCGKTTLLKTIDGLIAPSAGEVRVSGRPAHPRHGDMAVVFQQDSLYPWRTVLANVRFGLDVRGRRSAETDARSRECIELVGLRGFENHYPHQLSGGMRQRVNLARALAVDPTLLLMDEPFAALDAQTREVMQTELLDIWTKQRKTVVFITHQLDEAVLLADRVIVMAAHPGRIREEIRIDIPRPRDLHTKRGERFTGYVDHIWNLIEEEVRRSLIPGTAQDTRTGA